MFSWISFIFDTSSTFFLRSSHGTEIGLYYFKINFLNQSEYRKRLTFVRSRHLLIRYYPVCLSVLKLAPAEYATNVFSFKWKYENLADVVHVLQTTQNLVISRCCFAEDGKEMYKDL